MLLHSKGHQSMSALIDTKHLGLYVGDDVALRNEILNIYEDQLRHWMMCLNPSMADDDWYHANHTLKGASRGVGVWSIGDLCEGAETLTGKYSEKTEQRSELIAKLQALVPQVLTEVAVLCEDKAA